MVGQYKFDKLIMPGDPHLSSVTPSSRIDNYRETSLKKFAFLCQKCIELGAALVLPGDLFHRPNQPDEFKADVMILVRKLGVTVFTIPGNHDIRFYNLKMLPKSSLGNFLVSGVMKYLRETTIETSTGKVWKLVGHQIRANCPDLDSDTILVSHRSLGRDLGDGLYYPMEWVHDCPARLIHMGHDHIRYPLVEHSGTIIVRPGGMCRSTSKTEDKIRDPMYALVDLVKLEQGPWEDAISYEPIPCLPAEQVFEYVAKMSDDDQQDTFSRIHEFIDLLKNAKVEKSIYDILREMDVSIETFQLCTYYLENVGVYDRMDPIEIP